jgi:hypothetical protein
MMRTAFVLMALSLPVAAQTVEGLEGLEGIVQQPLPSFPMEGPIEGLEDEPVTEIETSIIVESLTISTVPVDVSVDSASAATLRGLDKVSGEVTDIALAVGESAEMGGLMVRLGECRYPVTNPSGDAFAWLEITADGEAPQFEGWMTASSPALNALDHPRYDIWVIRCNNS